MIFGSEEWPLRPSKLGKLIKCPMSVFLDGFFDDDDAGPGAQTGSLCHKAIEMYHRTVGDPITKEEAARAELIARQQEFPKGDIKKAAKWTSSYFADGENKVDPSHLECSVRLVIPAEPDIVIQGTLDQIRNGKVWDVKSGASLKALETVAEYQFQQAAYVLAARHTLGLDIQPGGIIDLKGYDVKYGQVFLPMNLTVADCEDMMELVKQKVLDIRAGRRQFQPSNGACQYCKHKWFPKCKREVEGIDRG